MAGDAALTCPFCAEPDFDPIGLKNHFMRGWCDVFNETPAVQHKSANPRTTEGTES